MTAGPAIALALALSVSSPALAQNERAAGESVVAGESAAAVAAGLRHLSLDPSQTYRVRELRLVRGDLQIYLAEGILGFAKPVLGHTVAAIFTTNHVEGGDAEVLSLPPSRAERASLASFAKSPNLDEHVTSAVFFFSDETRKELLEQMQATVLHPAPEEAPELAESADAIFRNGATEIDAKLIRGLLDSHKPQDGFFFGLMGGRTLGVFDVIYEPSRMESVTLGRTPPVDAAGKHFQIWSSYRSRHDPAFIPSTAAVSDYKLDITLRDDLGLAAVARFNYRAGAGDARVVPLDLAARLRASSATIDGRPAEVFQHAYATPEASKGAETFLLIAESPLAAGSTHQIEVRYQGAIIHETTPGSYFIDERNTWYPFLPASRASFDLTFHCPEKWRIASTGDSISEEVVNGIRTVHRKTAGPEVLAGFNVGDFFVAAEDHPPYRVELYSNRNSKLAAANLPSDAAAILQVYSQRWLSLPLHTLAISPIDGLFGQGFPGLIYLSTISYIREEDRPLALRSPGYDIFFSRLLLPHEIAHQWWGGIVSHANYRSAWLLEAMANYSALQYLEDRYGRPTTDAILQAYRGDVLGKSPLGMVESAGPVDFGERVLDTAGPAAWHMIVYEKGAWILHMLRMRLGDEAFHQMQVRLLQQFNGKTISNEQFRALLASLMPDGQPDKQLTLFFDDWIYGTGIPKLALRKSGASLVLKMTEVDEAFSADVPLRCTVPSGEEIVHWVRVASGENTFDMPKTARSCQLPSLTSYLYIQ